MRVSIPAVAWLSATMAMSPMTILQGCRPGPSAHAEAYTKAQAAAPVSARTAPVPVPPPLPPEHRLKVAATAYNSLKRQTDAHPNDAAWGDSLEPGLRSIAVSRDLLALGLKPGMVISIDSLAGRYIVLDKMDARWKRRIDIYFGRDVKSARAWGDRTVVLRWRDTTDARGQVLGKR